MPRSEPAECLYMGKKNRTSFRAGNQIGRRGGRPKGGASYTSEERVVRELSKEMLSRYISQNFFLTEEELRAKSQLKDLAAIELCLIKIILHILETGNACAFERLLDRAIGKAGNVMEEPAPLRYEEWSIEELLEERKRLQVINQSHLRYLEKQSSKDNSESPAT